jgi:hypothetical protein
MTEPSLITWELRRWRPSRAVRINEVIKKEEEVRFREEEGVP